MKMATFSGIFENSKTVIATVLTLLTSSTGLLAQSGLEIEIRAEREVLHLVDQVEFEIAGGMSGPTIYGVFSEQDGERFADFTEAHQGEIVRFTVCKVEVFAPIVQMRIDGGRFSMGITGRNKAMVGFLKNGCP